MPAFAHPVVVNSKDEVCRVELEAGQMAVLNNQRVMHGRDAFQGHRNLVG